ncbi:competence protein CoiA family protein [Streptomyces hirsutus]|uniref:competence protein CoiA family protein n=1 Tax=Streptomyces hirsutus TaxID=35620 RepID=UPI00368EC590
MANGVWHTGLETVLELDKDDLGLVGDHGIDTADLIAQLLQPVAERNRHLLKCVETSFGRRCKAELSGVQSQYMYVRRHRGPDGIPRLRAAHLPTTHVMTTVESDLHKALKEFMARTADDAGLEVYVEKAAKNRTSRPDVTITGVGGVNLGCEAQLYNASSGTVLRRSRAHASSGLTANWVTHDDSFHLIDRANWMLINQVTWRQVTNASDLPLVGGFRVLTEWRCTAAAQRPCPNGLVKTGCGKVHLEWDTPMRQEGEASGWTGYRGDRRKVAVGQALVGAATGAVTPLFVPSSRDPRTGSHLWVPSQDRDRWAEYRPVEEPTFKDAVVPEDAIHFSGMDAGLSCEFGEDTWKPSAPLKRRGSGELSITIDDVVALGGQASEDVTIQVAMEPVTLPDVPQQRAGNEFAGVRPGRKTCDAGITPCGEPGRLYACGWRCEVHRP